LKLAATGLTRFFDAVIFTEELGREFWKPSPKAFEMLQDKLGAGCVYVADNPAKDFVAPNKLGWLTIQYRHRSQLHADNPIAPAGRPQIVVSSPDQLLPALK